MTTIIGLPTEAPSCDKCDVGDQQQEKKMKKKNDAEFWCDTCSSLLCSACQSSHPRTHDVARLDEDEYEQNDNNNNNNNNNNNHRDDDARGNVAAGDEDDDTHLNLLTGEARKTKQKGASSSGSKIIVPPHHEQKKQISISEEKMASVLEMFEHSSPVAICQRLVTFLPEDEIERHHKDLAQPDRQHHRNEIAALFASLRQKCFAVIHNFYDFGQASGAVAASAAAAGSDGGSSRAASKSGSAAAASTAAFCGFGADSTIPAEKLADKEPLADIFSKLSALGAQLKTGVELAEQQPPTGTAELMVFERSGGRGGGSFTARDAIPCDGRVAVPGRAGRRVSCLLFCHNDSNNNSDIDNNNKNSNVSVTLRFLVDKDKLNDVKIEPPNGTLLVYLSGAPHEIVLNTGNGDGKLMVFAKWFW